MKVIVLIGKAGAGKDTFYNLVSKNKNYTFKRYAFADELKKTIIKKYNIPANLIFGSKKYLYYKKDLLNIREMCIAYGMYIRSMNEFYWVDKISCKIKKDKENVDIAVITDCRFLNEVESLYKKFEKKNIITIRIENPLKQEKINHISEKQLDEYKCDYTIINDKTKSTFEKEINNLMTRIL